MNVVPGLSNRHGGRIDQIGHVFGNYFYYRVLGLPAVLFDFRVIHPDQGFASFAALHQLPVGYGGSPKVFRGGGREIAFRCVPVILRNERFDGI